MTDSTIIPVLEIGGTHLTAALVETGTWRISSRMRVHLRAEGTAEELINDMSRAAYSLSGIRGPRWSVAIPGPFDYAQGIGRFEHVGKFDSLRGVNVREALMSRIHPTPEFIHFLNDADAFGIGEYVMGAARGHDRAVCITLGTGVGSFFLDRGRPVNSGPSVPLDGSIHHTGIRGRPLEDTVSRRAIRAAYAQATGTDAASAADVHTIAERSRSGDEAAKRVLNDAFEALGEALAVVVRCFDAGILVIGGSMAQSWDLVEPAIRAGLARAEPSPRSLTIEQAIRPDDAALVGAAYWAFHYAN